MTAISAQQAARAAATRAATVKRGGRQSQVRVLLEEEIASGRIKPGDRLIEKDLCLRFNVSRTPVREAVLQLAASGLVTVRPRQGAVVARLSVKQVATMWEVLAGLEALCAELAARRMPNETREQLARVHERTRSLVAGSDVVGYDECNSTLHELIYVGARNEYLAQSVRELRKRLQPYRRLPFKKAGGLERSFAGHDKVVHAILAGDAHTASEVMRDHVSGGLTFLDFIADLPEHVSED